MGFQKGISRPSLPHLSLPAYARSAGHYLLEEACELPLGHQTARFAEGCASACPFRTIIFPSPENEFYRFKCG